MHGVRICYIHNLLHKEDVTKLGLSVASMQ